MWDNEFFFLRGRLQRWCKRSECQVICSFGGKGKARRLVFIACFSSSFCSREATASPSNCRAPRSKTRPCR